MTDLNKTEQEPRSGLSDLTAGLADCKKCGGRPTTLIGGGLLRPKYWWTCSKCGDKPKESATYSGAWDKWQKHNKAANDKLRGCPTTEG